MTKRITIATIKSFIKKNANNLHLKKKHSFDGMTDGTSFETAHPFKRVTIDPIAHKNTLGIDGAWFTSSGNLFTAYDDGVYKGYEVYNCCGHFFIATK